jgi:hypothetical protein
MYIRHVCTYMDITPSSVAGAESQCRVFATKALSFGGMAFLLGEISNTSSSRYVVIAPPHLYLCPSGCCCHSLIRHQPQAAKFPEAWTRAGPGLLAAVGCAQKSETEPMTGWMRGSSRFVACLLPPVCRAGVVQCFHSSSALDNGTMALLVPTTDLVPCLVRSLFVADDVVGSENPWKGKWERGKQDAVWYGQK